MRTGKIKKTRHWPMNGVMITNIAITGWFQRLSAP
ncbi:MAG: hypothetical protein BWX79_02988 [Alphaproteobacteria bacterium ADurb.Bin100]|nr:MAG: hypothetical protein BWX79_02988 [Alphaproteobacteria bacterium ADurb.Bin100]